MARKTCDRKKERGRVRHTRAIQRDRTKRQVVAPPDEEITQRLSTLLQPAIAAQSAWVKLLGLRNRILSLSVMVAIVISMLWRQLGSGGSEVARLLHSEGLLWVPKLEVSQQAISQRLRTFPPVLFLNVLVHILPIVQARWRARQRPLPPVLAWAMERYTAVLAADGSTLDALLLKIGLLRGQEQHPLAGKMMVLQNVCSWLPLTLWLHDDAKVHDQRFWPNILEAVPAGALLLIDLGFTNFTAFVQASHFTFITRLKDGLSFRVTHIHRYSPHVRDMVGWIGSGKTKQRVRVVKVRYKGEWYAFLCNELDPTVLPVQHLVALYFERWRIEDAFNVVKRLLGLAYFWTSSQRGIHLQIWATWILYVLLVDLTDDVAEALDRPFVHLSMEMVYRSLYYSAQAHLRGETTDPIAYLADNVRWLGLLKRRPKRSLQRFSYLTNPSGP
jgi:hypothetical protein